MKEPPPSRLAALLLTGIALAGAAAAQPPRSGPNVVVIFADDLGYGDLGSYGSREAYTPNLDALADAGLRFTDFYAGGPVCTPSRYALLTGLHTFRAGDPNLLRPIGPGAIRTGINDDAVTVAEALRDGGYETAMIGKWHLGHGRFVAHGAPDTEYHPLHHGFDTFFGSLLGHINYNTHWYNGNFIDWWEDRRPAHEDSLRYATHVFGDRAVAYIDDHRGAGVNKPPFFLYLPFTAPHYGQDLQGNPKLQLPIGEEEAQLALFNHLYLGQETVANYARLWYLAMVAVLDEQVGRIVDALDRTKLTDNTVIWFISDNGGDPAFGGSNGALRGKKREPYEGGVRVPSFVVWPGRIAPGTTGQLGANVDVLPTLLGLADLPLGHAVDGVDLSGHLLGGPPVARGVAVPNAAFGDAYRLGNWKLVRRYTSAGAPRPAELYDLDADLAETKNLAAIYPHTVAMLLDRLPYGRPPGPDTLGMRMSADASMGVQGGAAASVRVLPNPSQADAPAAVEVVIPEAGAVRVEAFDALGRRLAVLHEGALEAGVWRLALPASVSGMVVVRAVGPFGTLTATAIRLR